MSHQPPHRVNESGAIYPKHGSERVFICLPFLLDRAAHFSYAFFLSLMLHHQAGPHTANATSSFLLYFYSLQNETTPHASCDQPV